MAQRVLGLLWGLTFAPGAPTEVAQSGVLSESLSYYAAKDANMGKLLVWDYMKRCVNQVRGILVILTPEGLKAIWCLHLAPCLMLVSLGKGYFFKTF